MLINSGLLHYSRKVTQNLTNKVGVAGKGAQGQRHTPPLLLHYCSNWHVQLQLQIWWLQNVLFLSLPNCSRTTNSQPAKIWNTNSQQPTNPFLTDVSWVNCNHSPEVNWNYVQLNQKKLQSESSWYASSMSSNTLALEQGEKKDF